jgi:hypothetical protein
MKARARWVTRKKGERLFDKKGGKGEHYGGSVSGSWIEEVY